MFDFSAYGSESCDTAWVDFGLDCASLEASYGWDCRGCECPGDELGTDTEDTTPTTEPTDETTTDDPTTPDDETTSDDDTTTGTTLDEDDTEQGDVQDDAALLDDPQQGLRLFGLSNGAVSVPSALFAASARRR